MQMWFSQYHTVNVKLDVRIQEQLFSGQSDYQKIDVFKSYEFGKMVALDGEIVFSDTDEFIYDEMVTHVPMAVTLLRHPENPMLSSCRQKWMRSVSAKSA